MLGGMATRKKTTGKRGPRPPSAKPGTVLYEKQLARYEGWRREQAKNAREPDPELASLAAEDRMPDGWHRFDMTIAGTKNGKRLQHTMSERAPTLAEAEQKGRRFLEEWGNWTDLEVLSVSKRRPGELWSETLRPRGR